MWIAAGAIRLFPLGAEFRQSGRIKINPDVGSFRVDSETTIRAKDFGAGKLPVQQAARNVALKIIVFLKHHLLRQQPKPLTNPPLVFRIITA